MGGTPPLGPDLSGPNAPSLDAFGAMACPRPVHLLKNQYVCATHKRRVYMESFLEKWARFVARWPLLIIAAWIILVAAALRFGPSINAVAAQQTNTSSLPASA